MTLGFQPRDFIAIYAAVVATGTALLQMSRSRRRDAIVRLNVSSNLRMFGVRHDPNTYLAFTADNVGDSPTMITHVAIMTYKNYWGFVRGKPNYQAMLADSPSGDQVPFLLESGHHFMALVKQNAQILELSRKSRLYGGIIHTASVKPLWMRIPPIPELVKQESRTADQFGRRADDHQELPLRLGGDNPKTG